MKLSKLDIRILMAIKSEGAPLANYTIAKRLGKHPSQTLKRLKIMANNKVLHCQEGYPKFYDYNSINKVQNWIIQTVVCPHCEKLHILHHEQITVQCDCKTLSGTRRRFYIYEKRITSKKVLTNTSEEVKPLPADEIEKDVNGIMGEK